MVDYYLSRGMKVIGYKNNDDKEMLGYFKPFERTIFDIISPGLFFGELRGLLASNGLEILRLNQKKELEVLEVKSKGSVSGVKSSEKFKFDCEEGQIKMAERFLQKDIKVVWVFYIESSKKFLEVPFDQLTISGIRRKKVKLPQNYRSMEKWRNIET